MIHSANYSAKYKKNSVKHKIWFIFITHLNSGLLTATADLTVCIAAGGTVKGMASFSSTTFGWNAANLAFSRLIADALVIVVAVCCVTCEGDTPDVVFWGLWDGVLATALSVCCVAGVGDTAGVLFWGLGDGDLETGVPPVCRVTCVEDAGDVLVFWGLGDGFVVVAVDVLSDCRGASDEAEDAEVLFPVWETENMSKSATKFAKPETYGSGLPVDPCCFCWARRFLILTMCSNLSEPLYTHSLCLSL